VEKRSGWYWSCGSVGGAAAERGSGGGGAAGASTSSDFFHSSGRNRADSPIQFLFRTNTNNVTAVADFLGADGARLVASPLPGRPQGARGGGAGRTRRLLYSSIATRHCCGSCGLVEFRWQLSLHRYGRYFGDARAWPDKTLTRRPLFSSTASRHSCGSRGSCLVVAAVQGLTRHPLPAQLPAVTLQLGLTGPDTGSPFLLNCRPVLLW